MKTCLTLLACIFCLSAVCAYTEICTQESGCEFTMGNAAGDHHPLGKSATPAHDFCCSALHLKHEPQTPLVFIPAFEDADRIVWVIPTYGSHATAPLLEPPNA